MKANSETSVAKTMTLRLKPPFRAVIVNPNEVVIRSGVWSGTSSSIKDRQEGGMIGRTMRLLDGLHTVGEIVEEIGSEHEEEIVGLFEKLLKGGLLEVVHKDMDAEELSLEMKGRLEPSQAFLSCISDQPLSSTYSHLRETRVGLIGSGVIGARVALQLAQAGIGELDILGNSNLTNKDIWLTPWLNSESVGEERGSVLSQRVGELVPTTVVRAMSSDGDLTADILDKVMQDSDFVVVASDAPNPPLYTRINDIALQRETTWMIATLDGVVGCVGPTFIPYKSCCYVCYEMRLESNIFREAVYQHYKKASTDLALKYGQTYIGLPSMADAIAGFLVQDCVRFIATGHGFTPGRIMRLDFQRGNIENNDVMKLPRCPACGRTAQGKPNEAVFETFERMIKDLGI